LTSKEFVWAEAKGFETDPWKMKKLWKHYGPGKLEIYKGNAKEIYFARINSTENKMRTLQQAIKQWQEQLDDWDSTCCNNSHDYLSDFGLLVAKPDDKVCSRELAWRQYVRIRDDNPNFPFNKENLN
jgi:hypothetical protein